MKKLLILLCFITINQSCSSDETNYLTTELRSEHMPGPYAADEETSCLYFRLRNVEPCNSCSSEFSGWNMRFHNFQITAGDMGSTYSWNTWYAIPVALPNPFDLKFLAYYGQYVYGRTIVNMDLKTINTGGTCGNDYFRNISFVQAENLINCATITNFNDIPVFTMTIELTSGCQFISPSACAITDLACGEMGGGDE